MVAAVREMGSQPTRTAFRSPWQNGVAERWVGSCRRDLLDHVIILNERHLKRLVSLYLLYYHEDRTYLGLGKDTPVGRVAALVSPSGSKIISWPRLGGRVHSNPGVDGPMIDPLISLAFAVSSGPGVDALVLGSGISRAFAIPTGWEVVVDFTRKLAAAMSETADPDPAGWFRSKFDAEPSYSGPLNRLAKAPTQRAALLRQYFEPTEEERSRGLPPATCGCW